MAPGLSSIAQMVPAEDAEGVERADMVACAAGGGGDGIGSELPTIQGAVPVLDN